MIAAPQKEMKGLKGRQGRGLFGVLAVPAVPVVPHTSGSVPITARTPQLNASSLSGIIAHFSFSA